MAFQARARPRTCRSGLQAGPHRISSKNPELLSSVSSAYELRRTCGGTAHPKSVSPTDISPNLREYQRGNEGACGWSPAHRAHFPGNIWTRLFELHTLRCVYRGQTLSINICCSMWHGTTHQASNIHRIRKNMGRTATTWLLGSMHFYFCRSRGDPTSELRHTIRNSSPVRSV